jgi:hypothetical protein
MTSSIVPINLIALHIPPLWKIAEVGVYPELLG